MKIKRLIKVCGLVVCSMLLVSCGDSVEKRAQGIESLIVQGKNFKGALSALDEALIEYPDNSNLKNLKEEVSEYIEAKELFYDKKYDEALQHLDNVKEDIMKNSCEELKERIGKQKESNKPLSSSNLKDYLKGSQKISQEEANFSVEEAFEIFASYEEESNNEKEYEYLMSLTSRSDEENNRLEEIKGTILGPSSISSNVYSDSEGIFRLGSQHYLFSDKGESIIYKVYKDKGVVKVS